ncbi:MAG: hypothetical protein O7D94_04690 [Planctomycetota bacterium]|nr:hypothetical protein [Planctomycetota bacterium]
MSIQNPDWTNSRSRVLVVFVLLTFLSTCGCMSRNGSNGVVQEEPALEQAESSPNVTTDNTNESDLGVFVPLDKSVPVQLIDGTPSQGRFPSGVSVVRVTAVVDSGRGSRGILAVSMASDRAVYWNHFVDDLPPIREVTMLRTLGIDPRGGSWKDFLRESVNVKCDLCLMYARIDDVDADAAFLAVLWDAVAARPLTTFRVAATIPEMVRKACQKGDSTDTRACDAEHVAESELRELVRNHLWDRVAVDASGETTEKSPWRNKLPLYPRDKGRRWVPLQVDPSRHQSRSMEDPPTEHRFLSPSNHDPHRGPDETPQDGLAELPERQSVAPDQR